jgi:hypothetical protein
MLDATSRSAAAALVVLASVAACARTTVTPAAVPAAPQTTLLIRLGADTVAMEQYTRTPRHMEGVIVSRSPATTVTRYNVELGADNAPTTVDYSVRSSGTANPNASMQSVVMRFGRDSVYVTGHRGSGDTTRVMAAAGELMPYGGAFGLLELALNKLRSAGRDSATFALVPMQFGARSTISMPLALTGSDRARYGWFGYPVAVRHDGRGNLLEVDGSASTIKVRVDRVAAVDIESVARGWTLADQTAGAVGPASTRDTVRAKVGAASLWIDYGRPSLRGRDVWRNGVLGDTLWRTGANAATQLHTDADIMIGGSVVPAGTYSLWTSASPNGYHLAVNKQFGQWGTEYDPKRDLVRVPLRETPLASPVERFTIAVDPQGTLLMSWGTKQLSVPVTAR